MLSITPTAIHELPIWMRRTLRPPDWGFAIALVLNILVASPMILMPGTTNGSDFEHWVYQTANTAAAFSEGRLYPRWSPHLLGGYGAPLPSFYPPAPAYIPAALQTILIGQPVEAVRLVFILALVLCGLPIYQFVARSSSASAGLVASALYITCPFAAFTIPVILGDLPAALCYLILPLCIWAFDRLLHINQRIDMLIASASFAALMLTDPRCALVGALMVGLVAVWHRANKSSAPLFAALAALALGLMMAAFYWLPAWMEQNTIRWRFLTDPHPIRIGLETLFLTTQQLDPSAEISIPQYSLGSALGVLSLLGTLAGIEQRRLHFGLIWLFAGVLFTASAMAFQVAWLLNGAAFCLCVGASQAVTLLLRLPSKVRPVLWGFTLGMIMLGALPLWLTARPPGREIDTSGRAQLQYELQGFGLAGLPAGWGLPTTLPQEIAYNAALLSSYAADSIEKIDRQMIPTGVQVGLLEQDSHSYRFQIQSDFADELTILTAAFPGWSASATSTDVSLSAAPDNGLLRLRFPGAINSDITITLGSTPVRILAWLLSATAVFLLLIGQRQGNSPEETLADYPLLNRAEMIGAVCVIVAAMLLAGAALGGTLASLRAVPGSGLADSTELRISTDAGIEAISYRLTRQGNDAELILYWRALRPPDRNLRVQVTLFDPASGAVFASPYLHHPGGYPTRRWLSSTYIPDIHRFTLPDLPDTIPVAARIEVYDCVQTCVPQSRVTFFDARGASLGQAFAIPISS